MALRLVYVVAFISASCAFFMLLHLALQPDMEDRVIELEALQKALIEGIAAYDKLQANIMKSKENLNKIFTSKDVKATLLYMVEKNEINRSLLALLDENIASARRGNEIQEAEYMEKIRGAVRKYYTVWC